MKILFWAIGVVLSLLTIVPTASATTYSVTLCFEFEVSYSDAAGGDWWNLSENKKARGIKAKVIQNSNSQIIYNTYTNTDTGCTSAITLTNTQTYTIKLYSDMSIGHGNIVQVRDINVDTPYYYTISTSFIPSANGTYYYAWQLDSSNMSNIAAATGYALWRLPAGLSDETFVVYPSPADDCSACSEGGDVYLSSDIGQLHKFVMAHEMAHSIWYKLDEGGPNRNYTSSSTSCPISSSNNGEHDWTSKEWTSAAVSEGTAHFYSAAVWNDESQLDCSFWYYKRVDFAPRDGTLEQFSSQNYDCENGTRFMQTYCTGETWTNRSVEVDWLRFWWDLHTDESIPVSDIFAIVDDSNSWAWTTIFNTSADLRNSADNLGYLSEWDQWAHFNGVDE